MSICVLAIPQDRFNVCSRRDTVIATRWVALQDFMIPFAHRSTSRAAHSARMRVTIMITWKCTIYVLVLCTVNIVST